VRVDNFGYYKDHPDVLSYGKPLLPHSRTPTD
jgi:hypothetical protein